jgi:nitroreductase
MTDTDSESARPNAAGRARYLVAMAARAPSLHNTQPWRFRIRGGCTAVEVLADPARMLPVADPRGRAAHISCGAALLNLRVAAAAAGLEPDVRLLPEPAQPLLLAEVRLAQAHPVTSWDLELRAAITRRRTNREPYSSRQVPPGIAAELAGAAEAEGAIWHVPDHEEAMRLHHLANDAELELLADPAYRAELDRWAGGAREADGIPGAAFGPRSPQGGDPVRRFTALRGQAGRYAWFEDCPQLAVLSVRAGGPLGWLAAGQAMERVWLTATCRGISLCPLTQPLEAGSGWLVRDARSGGEEPQMILRMGYGLPVTAEAPRRSVADVIDWIPAGPAGPEQHATPLA